MRPAKAPVRARFVGAALRTAQIAAAKGTIAMIGIHDHLVPMGAGREPKADDGKYRDSPEWYCDQNRRGFSRPPGACPPCQIDQREADDPDCENELHDEKNQSAGRYQIRADAQSDEREA